VSRCAQGFKGKPKELQNEAAKKVELEAPNCYNEFISFLVGFGPHGNGGRKETGSVVETRSRSRSPPRKLHGTGIDKGNVVTTDQYVGIRIAKMFNGSVFFGTVAEKVSGAVLAKEPDGKRQWQAVWKVVFDDEDSEDMNRLEIIDALKLYRLNESKDVHKPQPVMQSVEDDISVGENDIPYHGFPSSDTDFLDPRYCLLDLLTPTATQNRLSYLVELIIDKCQKRISNEALKERLRKDGIAFGAKDMPTDVRAIGRFLGCRSLQDVSRHRCAGEHCSYAWIGAVDERDFDSNDVCPECGEARYVLDCGKLKPRRVFFYFGAAKAIEALHRHLVFKANWKKNIDISLNSFRSSPDAERLNLATGNQALAEENGLYVSMADGFQSHLSSTQSITG
jgi:hypothetical protein